MFTIENYVIADSLEEAYKLNQSKTNAILGGILWMKLGNRKIQTAVDLSALGLDKIEETEDEFDIGCMVTERDLELSKELNEYFDGAIAKALKNIVGVQFRNCATVGGSIFSRFGFSDILTCLLALDTKVELYKGGIIPLSQFIGMAPDNDILVKVIIKKDDRSVSYLSHRKTATDFPILACAVSNFKGEWDVVLGARPGRAKLIHDKDNILSNDPTKEEIDDFITYVNEYTDFGTNMRGSKEYRRHLAGVLIKRGIHEISKERRK